MNEFLQFAELFTDAVDVRDPESGEMKRFFAFRLIAFRAVGHPLGDKAVFPPLHVSEHQAGEFLQALASGMRQCFPASSAPSESGEDCEAQAAPTRPH